MSKNLKLKSKFKKILKVIVLAAVLISAYILSREISSPIYFYKKGTDIPISDRQVKVTYSPLCFSSPCQSSVVYEGSTDQEGRIWIARKHAAKFNKRNQASEGVYEYQIEMDDFNRFHDYMSILKNSPNGSNKTYLIEELNLQKPTKIFLGQEFYGSLDITDNILKTFQLSSIDAKNQTVILKDLFASYGKARAYNEIFLTVGQPSYIPGEITDTQIILESVNDQYAIIQFNYSNKTSTWNKREHLDFENFFKTGVAKFSYNDALEAFGSIEEEYKKYDLHLRPYLSYALFLDAVGPLNDEEGNCIWVKFSLIGLSETFKKACTEAY